jgi:hypothetical protein
LTLPLRGLIIVGLEDYELIARELSGLAERVSHLENRLTDPAEPDGRRREGERALEGAALTTARALQEISGHWDAVYEAMRRKEG